jgi:hypothetical protein
MTRPLPSPLAISIRQRLLNYAKQQQRDFQEVLRQYAQERLLYCLSHPALAEAGFILKGALLFRLWDGAPHRATRDLDVLGSGESSVARFERLFKTLCQVNVEPPDGITWAEESVVVEGVREEEDYHGLRVVLTGYLAEARLRLQVDIGFGDAVTPAPVLITFPALLGLPPPQVRAYPPETAIAEKTQVMVRLELRNSRLKDYWDVWTLSQHLSFEGAILAQALQATFARRQTPLPTETPPAFTALFAEDALKRQQWHAFLNRAGVASGELTEVVHALHGFLWPPLQSLAQNEPFLLVWPPRGPWQLPSAPTGAG